MISHKHECIYVHIPKTAGKSVLAAFGLPEFGRHYDGSLDYIEKPYGHLAVRQMQGLPFYMEYFRFTFVRNPWDRLVSAFFYLNAGGANPIDAAFRDEHLLAFKGKFDWFIEELPSLARQVHFRPQVDWLKRGNGTIDIDYIGRFERFAEDFRQIANKLDLQLDSVPHRNRSKHRDYRTYYKPRQVDIVSKVYAEDIEAFDYSFE